MNTIMLISFLFLLSVRVESNETNHHPMSDEFIHIVNKQNSTWRAKRNFPIDTSPDRLKKLAGILSEEYFEYSGEDSYYDGLFYKSYDDPPSIPVAFDAREKWPHCPSIGRIRDQSICGSCWAIATTEVITDRICIHSGGNITIDISTEDLLTCCSACSPFDGCSGGYIEKAMQYWVDEGIVTGGDYGSETGCRSYSFFSCEAEFESRTRKRPPCPEYVDTPSCKRVCDITDRDVYHESLYFGLNAYKIDNDVIQIQTEIIKNGPVVAGFSVYNDFIHYHAGIYRNLMGSLLGKHAVKIIGWGEEDGVLYWLIANSYNEDFGENGFFRIARGTDECGIESEVVAGLPIIPSSLKNN